MRKLLVIAILLCFGCMPDEPESYMMRLELDSTLNSWVYEDAALVRDCDEECMQPKYDTATKKYYYDSLEACDYTFTVQSLFKAGQKDAIKLSHDTTIYIANKIAFTPLKLIDSTTLRAADTIEIVYTSNGCYHSHYEKLQLVKIPGGYALTKTNDPVAEAMLPAGPRQVAPTVLAGLTQLQTSLAAHHDSLDRSQILTVSTVRQSLYIKAGKAVFQFHDRALMDWEPYMSVFENYFVPKNAVVLP